MTQRDAILARLTRDFSRLTVHASGQSVEFWSADTVLCQAAVTEGLRIVNPA